VIDLIVEIRLARNGALREDAAVRRGNEDEAEGRGRSRDARRAPAALRRMGARTAPAPSTRPASANVSDACNARRFRSVRNSPSNRSTTPTKTPARMIQVTGEGSAKSKSLSKTNHEQTREAKR
jgi:hypothetical protein